MPISQISTFKCKWCKRVRVLHECKQEDCLAEGLCKICLPMAGHDMARIIVGCLAKIPPVSRFDLEGRA